MNKVEVAEFYIGDH